MSFVGDLFGGQGLDVPQLPGVTGKLPSPFAQPITAEPAARIDVPPQKPPDPTKPVDQVGRGGDYLGGGASLLGGGLPTTG